MLAAKSNQSISINQAIIAVLILALHLLYGLLISPMTEHGEQWSLQHIFLQASIFVFLQAIVIGIGLNTLKEGVIVKLKAAFPTLVLLLAIGGLVASWIASGTLPLLVYYGFEWISSEWFYVLAFLLGSVFSICVGSSWSTIATIGVVLVTIGQPAGAHLPALIGAIVGGAYFGDKLSPISDTTNIASVAAKIPVEQHIKGMLPTTIPAYILAALVYCILTLWFPITLGHQQSSLIGQTQQVLASTFVFSWVLLLPPLVLLIASLLHLSSLLSVLLSTAVALVMAMFIQHYDTTQIVALMWHGYQVELLAPTLINESPLMAKALSRGGVLMLWDAVEIVICAFLFIGMISAMKVLPTIVTYLCQSKFTPSRLMMYTLLSSGLVNSMTSSQYANSFIVSEAYGSKFDELGLHRKYLSRSLEDTGTMLESIVPWTTTAIFISGTLHTSVAEYWYWQLFTWFNLVLAFFLASTLSVNSKDV